MPNNLTTEEKQNQPSNQPVNEVKSNGDTNGEESAQRLHENHPLRPTFGIFKDDPNWDEFMEDIREYRRQVDEMTKEEE